MRWIWRIGWGFLAIAVLYFGALSIGMTAVVSWLLTPGGVDWSGASRPAPEDPFTIGYRGDPRVAFGYDFEAVRYAGPLGETDAWLIPAESASTLWAVYVHGIGGLRENGYRQLSVLHEAGIPTLMITYRNDTGAPPGQPPFFSFGLVEWEDLDAAVTWMLGQGAERIVVVAESMGGAIAGQFLMNASRADRVIALVLDSPALDFPAVLRAPLEKRYLPFASEITALGIGGLSVVHGIDMNRAIAFDIVRDFPGPVFLAHGSGDNLVPVSISDRLEAERAGPTTYLRTSAEHLHSWQEDPERYRAGMSAFLDALRQ